MPFPILTTQKNHLFEIVRSFGEDPKDFRWIDVGNANTKITYRNTEFYFQLYKLGGNDWFGFSPGESSLHQGNSFLAWDYVFVEFGNWISYIERELEIPDKWVELEKQVEQISTELRVDPKSLNVPFTRAEAKQVIEGVNQIRTYLVENSAKTELEQKLIESRLDYLIHATRTHKKIDWWNIAVGTIVQLLASMGVDPNISHNVWQMLKSAVSGVTKFLGT